MEDETLSCVTGATACALVWDKIQNSGVNFVEIKVKGGILRVEFARNIISCKFNIKHSSELPIRSVHKIK